MGMGRPKKTETGAFPTRERILATAIELFARYGYDAVSVRDITKALGLNEASLYNHFTNKADLLASIFRRLDERLIRPAFTSLPPGIFQGEGPFDLAEFLVNGARRFFRRADHDTLLTWRILMSNQYRYEAARDSVRTHLLEAPRLFFTDILSSLKEAGRIPQGTDCESVGRVIAAVFFDYSFRSNLDIAWNEEAVEEDEDEEDLKRLGEDLKLVASALKTDPAA